MHLYNTDACSCLSMNYIVFVCIEIDMDVHEGYRESQYTHVGLHSWFSRSSLIFASICLHEIRKKGVQVLFYFLKLCFKVLIKINCSLIWYYHIKSHQLLTDLMMNMTVIWMLCQSTTTFFVYIFFVFHVFLSSLFTC